MLNNLGDFKCVFCKVQILIMDLRDYLSIAKYKYLEAKEVDHLFQLDIGMLNATKISLDEEQRMLEMEIIIKWMKKDGLGNSEITNILTDMGYLKEKPNQYLSLVNSCPKCNHLLNLGCASCEACKIQICNLCLEVKDTNHECDEKVLDTIRHIFETCETCPKCHTIIEKEQGGCDQMFCTKCNTTFSWTTRRIVTENEVHHNPHFYDWQRKRGNERNPLDNPCEGYFLMKCENELENVTILPETLAASTLKKITKDDVSVDLGMYLKFVQGMLIHSIETIIGIQERDDFIRQQFRARYLTKCISFKRWKIRFKQHINTLRRNNETKSLLLTCLDGLYYIVLEAFANMTMIDQLFDIITTSLKHIQDNYGRTINYIVSTENVVLPYME